MAISSAISKQAMDKWPNLHVPTGLTLEDVPQLYHESDIVTGPVWENVTDPFSGKLLIQRSAILPSLCSQTFQGVCSCENGVIKCVCIEGLPSLDFSPGTFSLPDREDLTTLMISGCNNLILGQIFTTNVRSQIINTVVIFDINKLTLKMDALSFDNLTTVVMGNIQNIEMRKNAFEAFLLSKTFNKLYLEKVKLTRTNTRGIMKTLFHFPRKLSKLDVKDCSLGFLNYTLFRGESFFVNITNNKMIVESEDAIEITANHLEFTHNDVEGKELGAINFRVLDTLNFIANKMTDKDDYEGVNVLHVTFGEKMVKDVKIKNSTLGRLRGHFLDLDIEHIEISDCSMKLDNENIFNINTDTMLFKDNVVEAVVTEAISVTVADHADFVGNKFEHPQRESFYNILPVSNLTIIAFINNTFKDFEPGFLKMRPDLYDKVEDPRIIFENLTLEKSCDCTLSHSILCTDTPDNPGMHGDGDHHGMFEDILDQKIQCYFETEMTNLSVYKTSECSDKDIIVIKPVGRTVESASSWMWTGIVLGVVCLVVIAVLIVLRVKMIEQKMSRRAVDRFIVPASRSKEAPVDALEQASYWEPGSLPDLLAAVPSSMANSRSSSYHAYDNTLAIPEVTSLGKKALSASFYIGEDNQGERDRSNTAPASQTAPVSYRDTSLVVPSTPAKYESMIIHGSGRSSDLITEL
eukprot:GFUD01085923.1.p1 GENE.GFUD01085923.1~~GFUD01085923.1.p1  ORF type:complete len:714 (+),score=176.36 GFUD01085923.1:68-2143(+)